MADRELGRVADETGAMVPVAVNHDTVTIGQYQFGRQAMLNLMGHAAEAIWMAAENAQRGRGGGW